MDTVAEKNPKVPDHPSLGKLKQLGLESWWQTPLLLPQSWQDLRYPIVDFSHLRELEEGSSVIVQGLVGSTPKTAFQNGPPKLKVFVDDQLGSRIVTVFFGNTTEVRLAVGQTVTIAGKLKQLESMVSISDPELVDPMWVGRVRPQYQGKPRVIRPETVREKIVPGLRGNAHDAARVLFDRLHASDSGQALARACAIKDVEMLGSVIRSAHVPCTPHIGYKAVELLETLTAGIRLTEAGNGADETIDAPIAIKEGDIEDTISALPFILDEDQRHCIFGLIRKMNKATPLRAMLSGDVGSGKTAVFSSIAEIAARAGARVVIMAPSAPLAEQTLDRISQWWPQRCTALVTSASDKNPQALKQAQILVGSSALLFHDIGSIDLVIVDEQQRFSRAQREQLLGDGRCHLMEATATCIPRSMALVQLGHWDVFRIRGKHVEKSITTRLLEQDKDEYARDLLFADINATVRDGRQVLIVYPMKEVDVSDQQASHSQKRQTVEGAGGYFERLFPDRTRTIVGSDSETHKQRALYDMNAHRADILVATTVIEVGIDIPGLQRVVVISPERLGLMQLHQIRGRVGRGGGQAYMDLYAPQSLSEKATERLRVLVEEVDGFEIADRDMRLRGAGNISRDSNHQKGADEGLLFGRTLPIEALERASELIETGD